MAEEKEQLLEELLESRQFNRVRDMLRYTRNTAKPIAFNENGELVDAEF